MVSFAAAASTTDQCVVTNTGAGWAAALLLGAFAGLHCQLRQTRRMVTGKKLRPGKGLSRVCTSADFQSAYNARIVGMPRSILVLTTRSVPKADGKSALRSLQG